MRDACVEQWASAPRDAHHRLTRYLLDPDEPHGLCEYVANIDANGGNIAAPLMTEIRCLQMIPMDDEIIEGPHATAEFIGKKHRRSIWPWRASTHRLSQNIDDLKLLAAVGADLQTEWGRHKRVLSKPGLKQRYRPVKLSVKRVRGEVYTASKYVGFVAPTCGEGDDDLAYNAIVDGAPRADPLPIGDAIDRHRHERSASEGESSSASGPDGAAKQNTLVMRLLRQWLYASLSPGDFMTFQRTDEVDGAQLVPLQILSLETRAVDVRTYITETKRRSKRISCLVYALPLERWCPGQHEDARPPLCLQCFHVQDPNTRLGVSLVTFAPAESTHPRPPTLSFVESHSHFLFARSRRRSIC